MQFCLCLFIPNCTRNHVITCTYSIQRVEERRRKRRNWRKASVSPFEVGKTLKAPFSQGKMSQRILSVIVAVYKNWFQSLPFKQKMLSLLKKSIWVINWPLFPEISPNNIKLSAGGSIDSPQVSLATWRNLRLVWVVLSTSYTRRPSSNQSLQR